MSLRCLRFVLLIWFPGVLHAQIASPCEAPSLDDGYIVPAQLSYRHGMKLIYACESGHKPAGEGWWATSTCENGEWSHIPECIDEQSCLLPNIPNGKYTKTPKRWYRDGGRIRVACDKGYILKNHEATAECRNGTWLSVPICERSKDSCGEPPELLHAVIIHQSNQELFAVDSEVLYECRDGYFVEGTMTQQSLLCTAGSWNEGRACIRGSRLVSGHGGQPTTVGGAGTIDSEPTRPGDRGTPDVGDSTSSGHNERESERIITRIGRCGQIPHVQNGEILGNTDTDLTYQCVALYKREGPEKVVCYSDLTWSQLPTCKEDFCAVDTATYHWLKPFFGVKYVIDGQKAQFECLKNPRWWVDHYTEAQCTDGRIQFSRCCPWLYLKTKTC